VKYIYAKIFSKWCEVHADSAQSENALNIGPGEVVADAEEAACVGVRYLIGETVPEIHSCGVDAFSPLLVCL
jgi:hypothetical protein